MFGWRQTEKTKKLNAILVITNRIDTLEKRMVRTLAESLQNLKADIARLTDLASRAMAQAELARAAAATSKAAEVEANARAEEATKLAEQFRVELEDMRVQFSQLADVTPDEPSVPSAGDIDDGAQS